jgi:hypothetical protein
VGIHRTRASGQEPLTGPWEPGQKPPGLGPQLSGPGDILPRKVMGEEVKKGGEG